MNLKKTFWVGLGCVSAALGVVGAALPLLPAFPFLLLAAFCFGKSSERLHRRFTGTALYRRNLESYIQGRGMTRATKRRILLTVTLLMGFGFFMMLRKCLYLPCGILAGIWIFHLVYFLFGVKTCQPEARKEPAAPPEL